MIQKVIFARDYGDNNGNDLTVQASFATLQASFDSGGNWQSMSKSGAGLYSTSDFFQVTSGVNWSTANATGFTGDIWLRENSAASIDKYKYKAYNYLTQPIDGITFIAKQNGANIDLIVQCQADNNGENNGQTQLNNANSDYASTVPSPIIQWYFNNQTPVVGSYSFVVGANSPNVISFDRNLFPAVVTQTAAPTISTASISTATTSIAGTSVANATVKVLSDGAEIASVTANGSGAWTATIASQTVRKIITAKAIEGSNTLSNASNSVTVTAVPVNQTATPTISTSSISTATTTVSGTSVASATVKVLSDVAEIASVTANGSGAWTATIATQTVGKVITTKAIIAGSSLSNASNAITVTAIAAVQTVVPVITSSALTTISTSIIGTSVANASITILADTTQIGTGTANASGDFTVTIPVQTAGKVITAKAQAGANTLSNASNAVTIANFLGSSSSSSNVTASTDKPDVEPTAKDDYIIPLAVLTVALFIGAAAGFINGKKALGILAFLGFLVALSTLIYRKNNP